MPSDIRIEDLTKAFRGPGGKSVTALDGLNLEVESGEIFGLLGPNGAGKTTTLNLLLGFIFPTRGRAFILDKKIENLEVRQRIGFLPEMPASYEYLNPVETLHFYGSLFGLSPNENSDRTDELLEAVRLSSDKKKRLGGFSKGMRQRVAMAECLINDPTVLLMDEPTSGLDPIGRMEARQLLLKLKERGKTILLCSHLLAEMELVCDRIGILYKGRLLRVGKIRELLTEKVRYEIVIKKPAYDIGGLKKLPIESAEEGDTIKMLTTDMDIAHRALRQIQEADATLISFTPRQETLEMLFMRIIGEENPKH